MTSPNTAVRQPGEADEGSIRRSWRLFAGTIFVLGIIVAIRLGTDLARPIDWAIAGLLVVVGLAAVRHRLAVQALETGRRAEAESFARILQGLSRSVSPDAIVDAIVEELGAGTGADHIVVVRRRPDSRVLEATLVNARTGGPASTTLLPISDLEDPPDLPDEERGEPLAVPVATDATPVVVPLRPTSRTALRPAERAGLRPARPGGRPNRDAAFLVAERIAQRVRRVYGFKHTIAAPLWIESGVVGAIVVSRRLAEPWPASAHRVLAGAALEASAALGRVYSHRQAEARATTDALTGLPNRRYFDEFCSLLGRRRRAEDAVGVLMVDIDRFKALNDAHGHAVGDEVLRAVAGAITGAVREDDVPARFGGEEFAVLLRNPSLEIAVEVGERVREAVADLDLAPLGVSGVSVSVGVAVAASATQPISAIVEQADRALYEAKRGGRDRVVAA